MSNNPKKTTVPAELKTLPIFQVIGDHLPEVAKKPENQKIIAQIFFWAAVISGSYVFITVLPTLIQYAEQTIWLIVYSILIVVLIMLYPKIISLLYNVGKLLIFKGEKALIRSSPIDTLQMLLMDAKDTLKKVKEKISSVEAVQIDMVSNSEASKKEAEEKYTQLKSLTEIAKKLDKESQELDAQGNKEKARKLEREAKETRLSANLRMQEGKASEENARLYAQYANQFAKVTEILRDNESAARIYVSALDSSISIITKKMEATNKMKNATEGLAEVFNIKDSWKFQEAMDAATTAISSNIASIRMNLDFLEESRGTVSGLQPSQADLESFVKEIDGGRLHTLNVSEITDASYELKPSEKVDKGFNLLD
ncbi:MAG: hypothetical protein NW226_23255 [Microscillaceae bacterium]|nr:hypothetical protein [Microscillaceae bacterium]